MRIKQSIIRLNCVSWACDIDAIDTVKEDTIWLMQVELLQGSMLKNRDL